MTRKITLLALLTLLWTSLSLSAQTTLIATGKVEKLATAAKCAKMAKHRFKCTDIHLLPGTGVDLTKWEGRTVDIEYSLVLTGVTCVTLEVKKIASARYSLTISPRNGGQNRLGDRVRFEQRAPFLSLVPFVFAAKPGFVPLAQYGTLQSDILSLLWIKNDIALFGRTRNDITIPNDKALIGAFILTQGMYVSISTNGANGRILNVDCFTIQKR